MRKSGLLKNLCLVCSCLGLGIFNSALALDSPPLITRQPTLELKPIPSEAFQLAKSTFLPDYVEGPFSGYSSPMDYNPKGDCDDTSSLYTKNNCTYPKTVVPSSQCPFKPGYYKECKCLPQFKLTSCKSPYILGGDSCEGKYEKCVCPSSVSLYYPNDYCTKYCEGKCIAKSCSPDRDETGCQYGTGSTSDGCGGTRTYCKSCSPLSSETGCQYGTYSCSDSCGGTRTCCSSAPVCTPYSSETGCQYGTYSCSDGCGGTRTCCSSKPEEPAEPTESINPCDGVSCPTAKSCSNGCASYSSATSCCSSVCTACKSDPCAGVSCPTAKSCSNGCASYSSATSCCSSVCTACKSDPCAGVSCPTAKSCSNGCASYSSATSCCSSVCTACKVTVNNGGSTSSGGGKGCVGKNCEFNDLGFADSSIMDRP